MWLNDDGLSYADLIHSQVQMLSKYDDYCTSRSRAEVLLRQLTTDEFLVEKVRQQGHNATLCSQLLLPAKRITYYNKFLQVCAGERQLQ